MNVKTFFKLKSVRRGMLYGFLYTLAGFPILLVTGSTGVGAAMILTFLNMPAIILASLTLAPLYALLAPDSANLIYFSMLAIPLMNMVIGVLLCLFYEYPWKAMKKKAMKK